MSEQIYDAEIAPLLAQVGLLCVKHGLPLVAQVEYSPGEYGLTQWLGKESSLPMLILSWAAQPRNNVDLLIMKIAEYAREHGHTSAMLKTLGVPVTPGG